MNAADLFAEYRPLLFTVAYEITGSATDAEDVLQESYLRVTEVDTDTVDNVRAYLAQVVTRQSLNLLRSARRRREEYVGNWLPEPVRTGPDAAADVLLAESVSVAMLLVLETLGPDERAVFVLREVFGFGYDEIAQSIGKNTAAARQIGHRAREHVRARRKRFDPPDAETEKITGKFLEVGLTGDVQGLMDLLAPDAVQLSDGGGKVSAARVPVVGAERVARFVAGLVRIGLPDMRVESTRLNAMPALLVYSAEVLDVAMMFEVTGGLITGLYMVRNPDKLTGLGRDVVLAR
ncbi:RNA polymerase sigma-70 factor [Rhodococcus triatomae]|uniref:RNA polymerase sigma-70 factor, ECF subfamily n=1 Tax=Rhodococcus triatomae TaxID=300028 RepID=A0A1G8A4B6_9NOCA|nr:RNA polymerase sigma-70 factor [Rhodococcus triatomae]QNG17861.1 RNA polymerase sigma-70 factor [Rhodococcus triatomae]QNG22471.1 RNA polymerase sigma-70 factor [Rhodococcus triatomae]SDH15768.1 RNA polymerase sigma-70 factor, ECF subfamily [Rhodococcus triatomae]